MRVHVHLLAQLDVSPSAFLSLVAVKLDNALWHMCHVHDACVTSDTLRRATSHMAELWPFGDVPQLTRLSFYNGGWHPIPTAITALTTLLEVL